MPQVTSGATLLRGDFAFRKCMNFRASALHAAPPSRRLLLVMERFRDRPAGPFDLAQGRLPALLFEVLQNLPRCICTRTSGQARAGVRAAAAQI
jgi:hypothetical protein